MDDLIMFPDSGAIVALYLAANLPSVPIRSRVPAERPDQFVTVQRVGGPRRNLVVDQPTLAIECWAETDEDAHDLAQLVRAWVHTLAGQSYAGHYVYRVDEFSGPANLPDPTSHQSRYVFTITLAVRGDVDVAS